MYLIRENRIGWLKFACNADWIFYLSAYRLSMFFFSSRAKQPNRHSYVWMCLYISSPKETQFLSLFLCLFIQEWIGALVVVEVVEVNSLQSAPLCLCFCLDVFKIIEKEREIDKSMPEGEFSGWKSYYLPVTKK